MLTHRRLLMSMMVAFMVLGRIGPSVSVAEKPKKPSFDPLIKEIGPSKLLRPIKPFGRKKPMAIKTLKDLKKVFSEKDVAKIKEQVDFEKRFLVFFQWGNSGGDRFSYRIDKKKKKPEIVFTFRRGRTDDFIPRSGLYAIKIGINWRFQQLPQ